MTTDIRRRWLIGGGAVVLLAAVAAGPTVVAQFTKGPASPALATVARRSFPVVATASGSVVPASQIALNFQVAGQVTEVDVAVGDHVTAGQVLARLDDASQQANVQAAESAVSAAQQAVNGAGGPDTSALRALQQAVTNAQSSYTQVAAVTQENVVNACGDPTSAQCAQAQADRQTQISQAQGRLQTAQANLAAAAPNQTAIGNAETQLANAQGQLARAQADLAKTSLTAPADATVLAVNGSAGESVVASGTSSPILPNGTGPVPATSGAGALGRAFVVLGDGSSYQVAAPFSESDVVNLVSGQQGTIEFDAIPGLMVNGHVVAVATAATAVNGVTMYYASISLDNADQRLRSGMTANVSIQVEQVTDALSVPNTALYQTSSGPHVDVWYKGKATPTAVQVGKIGDTLTEILGGLSEGEQVVLSTHNPNIVPSVPAALNQVTPNP